MFRPSFRPCVFVLLIAPGILPRAQAVSTYTCSTFTKSSEPSFPRVFPTGINNARNIAGSFYSSASGVFPFFTDESGMDLPFAVPPFATSPQYIISSVNNQGQVAGTALDTTLSPALYRGFISNADGTYFVIEPPANTPNQRFSDILVFGINDRGETSGLVPITSADNLTRDYRFKRDSAGFFSFFDPGPPYTLFLPSGNISNFIDPRFQTKINNSGAVLLGNPFFNTLRLPDGTERLLRYPIDNTPATFYGLNNTGLLVGDALAPFVMDTSGNAPAVVCPNSADPISFFRAYALNNDGVVTGAIEFSDTVFVATPTGFHSGLQLSDREWGFSPNPVGVQGGSGTIYIGSTGTADLNFVSISIGAREPSDSPRDFTITGNTCMPQQYVATPLPPGQFCAISFTFTPTGPGARTAQIQVEDDAPDAPHFIRLNATGLGKGALQFSNGYWQFNAQAVGRTSGPGTIYIYNPGTDPINVASIAVSGANASEFAITAISCGSVIAPYTTCSVSFAFTPQATGARSAALVFRDDSGTGRQVVPLSGVGF
jgi:hypothetical protein